MNKTKHLILFDGICPMCNLFVRHIIDIDLHHRFLFVPLEDEEAKKNLRDQYDALIQKDTIVLIEHYQSNHPKIKIRSRAFLRIYWIVGGAWRLLGIFSFLPAWLGDIIYRIFAKKRKRSFIPK